MITVQLSTTLNCYGVTDTVCYTNRSSSVVVRQESFTAITCIAEPMVGIDSSRETKAAWKRYTVKK